MRRLANLYILLFVIDGALSLGAEWLAFQGLPDAGLAPLRVVINQIVIALSLVIYAALAIDRRLPKRILLPLCGYACWSALALWPLSGVIDRAELPLVAAAAQLGLVALLLVFRRGRLLLPEAAFRSPLFSWRNTLWFTLINLLLLPVLLVFGTLALANVYLESQTAGFLRISPVGIYMAERSYQRGTQDIRLAGMMHIGKADYYQNLTESIPTEETIILAEGVTDRDGLLEHDFDYAQLARLLGLRSQLTMQIDGRRVALENLGERTSIRGGQPDIALADIDLSRFDPQTIEFLNVLGQTLFGDASLPAGLTQYNDWVNDNMTPERIETVMTDLIEKRNASLIAGMRRALPYYDTIIIPWGAMHMPGIQAAVLQDGFVLQTTRERLSLDFRQLPYDQLWQILSRLGQKD
ncbi:MAG: hypothetical protein P8Y96_09955 [Desulfuromonadales bacterium]|jgi:hypothetical protein